MIRAILIIAGLSGVTLLFYDAVNFPWSQHSLIGTEQLFDRSVPNGSFFFLLLLVFRLPILLFLLTAFYQAERWRYYLGATEIRPIWTDDLNPDAY